MTRFSDAKASLAVAAGITLVYALFGLAVLEPEGLYSGDIGVKFVQARALAASGFRSLDLPYPGEFLDPSREFFPMRPPFVLQAGAETQAIFSPIVAVLQGGMSVVAGLRGLVILSVLSAAAILIAVRQIAPSPLKTISVAAVGIASPLWSYAVIGFEHAPAVACSTAAFAVALRSNKPVGFIAAGVLLGIGCLLRDEVLLLLPGLLLAIGWRVRAATPAALAAAASLVVLLCGVAVDTWWFGRPAAVHLRHAVDLIPGADTPLAADVPKLERMTIRGRYEAVIQYWLLGYGRDGWIVLFTLTFAAVMAMRWRWPSDRGAVPLLLWLGAVLALALIDVWELTTAPKWLAGLHRVAPYLVFAVLPPPVRGARTGWLTSLALITSIVFVAAAFAATNTTGGKSLGPRLLLPLLPLLAVGAIARIAAYLSADGRVERTIGTVGVALVLAGGMLHILGTAPAYYSRNQDDALAVKLALHSPARVVVADDVFTAQLLFPLYYRKIVLLADTHELRARVGHRLMEAKVPEVLLMSRRPEPGMRLSPLKIRQSDHFGRFYIQYWGRVGRDLK